MLFRAILRQDCYFFDTPGREPGALCGFLAGDTEAVHLLWGPSIGYKIQAAANLATGLGIALYFSWRVALVTLAAFPVLMVTGAVQQMMLVGFGALNKERSSADNVAAESLSQIRTVTAFNIRSFQSRLYETLLKGQLKISERNAFISGGLFGFSQFNFYGTFALGFWYGGTLIAVGKASFADVIIACMAVLMAAMGAGEAGGFASKAKDADVAAKRVFALIDRVPTIDSTPDSTSPDVALDTPLPPFDVKFRGVRFIYPTRPRSIVLQHLTTEFNNGRQYGLIGSTGCGKSTIIQLLARFYDPVKGHIEVNGQSLSHLNVRKWREHIGYVQQEPALFSGTVMENIKYAVPDASDEEAMECARYANIHDEILAMADGYNSQVGYRGSQLSGGQKQRVAMARALLRKPKLLLLDEATSALDNVSEAKVMKGVGEAYKKSPFTVVCVAHRLTTIVNADSILLLEAGQIAESGSHQSLLALDGDYKRRWEQYISSQS
jgi:ATP-binding cassette subfamily B (MDR/TAP) protein 1